MTPSAQCRHAREIAAIRHLQSLACARDVGVALENQGAAERDHAVATNRMGDLETEWRAALHGPASLPELAQAWGAQIRGQSHAVTLTDGRLRAAQAALLEQRKTWQIALVRETEAEANRDKLEQRDRAERDEQALCEASDLHLARRRSR